MARAASPEDFPVNVDGVGRFVFGQRDMRSQFAIEAEFKRLTEGEIEFSSYFGELASHVADLKVLAVSAPDDWDPDGFDPYDEESYAKINLVWSALRDKEMTFRGRSKAKPKGAGQGSGEDADLLVSTALQTDAD
jgi:hypothetical protein